MLSELLAEFVGVNRPLRPVPPGDPIDGPEDSERRELRIDGTEFTLLDAAVDHLAKGPLVSITGADDLLLPLG